MVINLAISSHCDRSSLEIRKLYRQIQRQVHCDHQTEVREEKNLETITIVQNLLFVSQPLIMRGISIMGFKRRSGDWKEDGKSLPTSEAARGELSVLANQRALSDLATNQTPSREY